MKLNLSKQVLTSLCQIQGIGKRTALNLCYQINIRPNLKASILTPFQIRLLQDKIQLFLQSTKNSPENSKKAIQQLIKIRHYRGLRHRLNLPVRGQRTKTNARTVRKMSFK